MIKMKSMKFLILLMGLFSVLAACSSQTENGTKEPDKASTSTNTSNTETASAQTKPLSEMNLDDLVIYFAELKLIDKNGKNALIGGIGTKAVKYEKEGIELYWYDMKNLDPLLQKQYDDAKKDGIITLEPSKVQIPVEVNGPFAIVITHTPNGEKFSDALKALK